VAHRYRHLRRSLCCYKGVTRVLQGCYKGVARVLQGCNKGVTRVLQGCYKAIIVIFVALCGVTRVLQGCYKGVIRPLSSSSSLSVVCGSYYAMHVVMMYSRRLACIQSERVERL
jgi:hypothetical protein